MKTEKLRRIYDYLEQNQYDAMVIGRRDNFAWLTDGQESGVVLNQEIGFVYLVITKKENFAVAMRADIDKAISEQLSGLNMKPIEIDWKYGSKEQKVLELTKNMKVVSDIPLEGAVIDIAGIYDLEFPMMDYEVDRYIEFGKECDELLCEFSEYVKKGITENQLKSIFIGLCAKKRIEVDVLLLGSDERISQYRHCTPTDKDIQKTLLISPALRKNGLHSNLARMISIGVPDEVTQKAYDAVSEIQANIIVESKEGVRFSSILDLQEKMYREKHYEEDWMRHLHGAPIGYMLSYGDVMFSEETEMMYNQAYEWYVTVTGAKSAELVMNINNKIKVLSMSGAWPSRIYRINNNEICLPDILIK